MITLSLISRKQCFLFSIARSARCRKYLTCITDETVNDFEDQISLDKRLMSLALRHAQHAFREEEVPVGAIIVDANNTVIAASRNRVEETSDATAHAEIDCIRRASKYLNNWRLHNCTIYSTLEPCPMCMSALQAARVKRVVYGAKDLRLGACGSFVNLVNNSRIDDTKHPFHSVQVTGGVLADQSSLLLRRFFQVARRRDIERGWDDPDVDQTLNH
eukprot:gene26745-35055_t